MHRYIIAREDGNQRTEFWGRTDGILEWVTTENYTLCWSSAVAAVQNAKELEVDCYVIEDYGRVHQKVHETLMASNIGCQCEICMRWGCGQETANYICDTCQQSLPLLLKSAGNLEPLREVLTLYNTPRSRSKATGDTSWWLNKFVVEVEKLLE
jgi:hypothetical protein